MQKGQFTMRKPHSIFLLLLLAFVFLSAFSTAAVADDDPPGRVARLNYMQGSVSFQPGGETDWVQASPNRPLTTGDNLWTDRNSRGELHISSTVIRLSSETGISFLNLNDRTVQIQLAQGSLNFRLRRLDGGDAFEIDTPNLAFTVHRPGEYRVDVDPNGSATVITVREGEGEATGGGSNFHLDSGESARVTGTDSLTYDEGQAGRPDAFDEWCISRDDREEHAQSARYVSRDVTGYEDLDDYGEWRSVPEYGSVWFPGHVAAGWAPYRFGHWVWIVPWGWTWVEDEPWGFAPFHYGRWATVGGGWCWVPGPVVVRPVYAPALVAFVGGPRFSLSLSIGGGGGGVAWFPLGPREVYVPAYRASPRYVQNVNVTNTTVNVVNVTNVYNNVNVNNVNVNNVTYMHQNNISAVTAVSHDTFVNARPVAAAAVRINPQQLQAAQVQRGAPVAPVQKSIVGAGAAASVMPPQGVMSRQVVAKEAPAPPPVSYAKQQQVLSSQPGRVPAQQQMDQLRRPQVQQQQPPVKLAPPTQGNQNTSQLGSVSAQPQQQPAGKFGPPTQGNQNTSQAGSVSAQQQQHPAGNFAPPTRGNQNTSQAGSVPGQQQQQPAGKFAPPAQGNQNASQPGSVPAQQQQPAGKFGPPTRVNQNTSQPGSVSAQPQQQPAEKFAPPAHVNQTASQPVSIPAQQQQHSAGNFAPTPRGNQNASQPSRVPEQQQPPVKFAPPARVNEDTYHPHQFERPQNAPAPKTEKAPEKAPERPPEPRGQEPNRQGGGEQERKQPR
jgi:hypothetical protein